MIHSMSTLAGVLVQISLFQGMSQATRDAVRAVAMLLAQVKPSNEAATPTEDFVDRVAVKLVGVVKTATQAAVEEHILQLIFAAQSVRTTCVI